MMVLIWSCWTIQGIRDTTKAEFKLVTSKCALLRLLYATMNTVNK